MIIIRNIRLEKDDKKVLKKKIQKILNINDNFKYEIYRKSIDARRGIVFNYQVLVDIDIDDKKLSKIKDAEKFQEKKYIIDPPYKEKTVTIIGFGPAGIFCGYILAKYGYKPVVVERGKDVENRQKDIEHFLETGELLENSNVQFGEGGAGTFSDGKLTARSKDFRQREVLKILVENGAPEEIMYDQKPHIGTDKLIIVMKNMREYIKSKGGEVHFETTMLDIVEEDNTVKAIKTTKGEFASDEFVLALGHSARDTFYTLSKKLEMENKPFAVGFRIEHPQSLVNLSQYKVEDSSLPQASYMLTHQVEEYEKGVYTFCMCPGGYVINASSEKNHLCVNGMSFYKRDGRNANSAIICTIDENLYGKNLLDGIKFQREIEEKVFKLGGENYFAPVQRIEDFLENKTSTRVGNIIPTVKPGYVLSNLNDIYPEEITNSIKEAIINMDKKLHGFAIEDGILTAAETRSSSPVRILRNENLQSTKYNNIYPIGEGSGYSGGIVSSAIDGIKAAEKIIKGE